MKSLRQLEARLGKYVAVTSSEIEDGSAGADLKGLYVFRETDGSKFMWSPRPVRYEMHTVDLVSEADEITFKCPKCFETESEYCHSVMVSFAGRNYSDEVGTRDSDGKPSRWNASGTNLDDLVLTPSILLDAKRPADQGCHWHGFVGSSGIPPGHAG